MKHIIDVVAMVVMGAVTHGTATAAGKLAEGVGLASAVAECRMYTGHGKGVLHPLYMLDPTGARGEQCAPHPKILRPTSYILQALGVEQCGQCPEEYLASYTLYPTSYRRSRRTPWTIS